MPFGCLVAYSPKPETIKALPKFAPRGERGVLVGYRLHSGGRWTRDYLVFPVHYFDNYDYARPRNLLELVPVTTQEVTPMAGDDYEFCFPLKANYDRYRNFPSSQLPACILRLAEAHECDDFEDKPDTDEATVAGGQQPDKGDPTPESPEPSADVLEQPAEYLAALFGEPKKEEYHWREDAIGRRYKYDAYGNRVYSRPLHGSKRPPTIPDK